MIPIEIKKSNLQSFLLFFIFVSCYTEIQAMDLWIEKENAAHIPAHTEDSIGFTNLMSWYGWNHAEQHKALWNLLQRAGINEKEIIKNTADVEGMIRLVEMTQQAFFRRAPGQERKDLTTVDWIEAYKKENQEDLKTLGFFEGQSIKTDAYDRIVVLGSSLSGMEKRLRYVLENSLKNGADIMVLAGERFLSSVDDVDAHKENMIRSILQYPSPIQVITESHDIQVYRYDPMAPLTETDLAAYLCTEMKLPSGHSGYILHTPKGHLLRPTTETTVANFINWIIKNNLQHKTILFVSDYPYVKAQEAMIENIIKAKEIQLQYAVSGPTASTDCNLQRILSELGGYIYAKTFSILAKMDIDNISQENKDKFLQLYKNQFVLLPYLQGIFEKEFKPGSIKAGWPNTDCTKKES